MSDAQQQFKIEEFRQLHEHIRTFETALSSIFTVSLVACTTLLTATLAWFFETYRTDPSKIPVALCYLFLSPGVLSVLALALISSYRTAVYRNGYYIKVFFENEGEWPRWHVDLGEYRKYMHGEHGKPVAFMFWGLFVISVGLFCLSLWLIRPQPWWHYTACAPLWMLMIAQHLSFAGDRKRIEDAWNLVKRAKRDDQGRV